MVILRVLAALLCLGSLDGSCLDGQCSDDELTSLIQTIAVVQQRGPGEHARPVIPVNMSNVQVAAATRFEEVPEVEPGWGYGLHAPHQKARTTGEVLGVCLIVIFVVSVGWIAYYCKTNYGQQASSGSGRPSPTNSDRPVQMPFFRLVLLASSFCFCSWGMNVVNKSLVIYLGTPALVTAAQMAMAAIGTILLARDRIKGEWEQIFKWCVIPFIFFAMLLSSFYTYKYLTLSVLMIIRNMGPIITLPIEAVVMSSEKRPYVTMQMVLALVVIFAATCVYCDLIKVSYHGLGLAFLNMVLAVADRVAQRRLLTTECQGLPTETCMLLNNVVGIVPTMGLAIWWGEFGKLDTRKWFLSVSTILLVLSGIIGTGICYFAIAVQREISATSFMVLQNVVRVAVVAVGVLIFLDPLGWPYQVIGLLMSFGGALWYGKAQIDGATELKRIESAAKEAQDMSFEAQAQAKLQAGDGVMDPDDKIAKPA